MNPHISDSIPNWFFRLRWFSLAGQLIVLCAAQFILKLTLPVIPILVLLILIPLSSLVGNMLVKKGRPLKQITAALLLLDTSLLTALLMLTGGPTNPFSIVYFLHVVLAAILLGEGWSWGIATLSAVCFASLFIFSLPIPEWADHGAHSGLSNHLHGMLVSYVAVSFLAAYFVNRILEQLRTQREKINQLSLINAKQQRLAAMTSLAAGAAHELSTPLGTMTLICGELQIALAKHNLDQEIISDLKLMQHELKRSKGILQNLIERSGGISGESPSDFALLDLLSQIIHELKRYQVPIIVESGSGIGAIKTYREALYQALRNLIKNSVEASLSDLQTVYIYINIEQERLNVTIKDQGEGIAAVLLPHLGEPFCSSKKSHGGLGLGVYLAKLTAEQLGGTLRFESAPNQGTTSYFSIPINLHSIMERKVA